MIVEATFDNDGSSYRLTRIHRIDGHTIRVRVHRDFYPRQSWAVAEVLAPALTWTELTTAPASGWHPDTPGKASDPATLQPIAEQLTDRARAILAAHPASPHPTTPDPPSD